MKILDLFAGIGVASLAAEQVWPGIEHEFVEINPFAQTILKKHFPNSKIYGDIKSYSPSEPVDIVWGSPPCQAASVAGKQKGKSDDRWLWPEYFRVVAEAKPRWVVAENVRGLLNLENGVVFKELCTELENLGYEVQSLLIPACAVNAPHRRDRVWLIGHATGDGLNGPKNTKSDTQGSNRNKTGENELCQHQGADSLWEDVTDTQGVGGERAKPKGDSGGQPEVQTGNGDSTSADTDNGRQEVSQQQTAGDKQHDSNAPDSESKGLEGGNTERTGSTDGRNTEQPVSYGWDNEGYPDWNCDWKRIAQETCTQTSPALCGIYDGASQGVHRLGDGTEISQARWKKEALKALGNSLVLQNVIKLFEAIRYVEPLNPKKDE